MLVPATHVLAAGGQIGEVTGFMKTAAVRFREAQGWWTSLGRVRNFDWMHVQATRL